MRNAGRAVAIVAALALAAVATFGITTYVRGVEDRAFEDAELVEVFVATQDIPAGVTAQEASEAGVIDRENRPRRAVPNGALSSLDQIDGLIALERILDGEVLVIGRWGDTVAARTQLDIPEGFEAVAVQVGIPPGVAGFVRGGDRVSLVAHVSGAGLADDDLDEEAETADETRSQYLLQDVDVLSVGQRVTTAEGEESTEDAGGGILMTIALEPVDIERLVFAINEAELYFTLLPEDAEPQDTPGRTFEDLFQ